MIKNYSTKAKTVDTKYRISDLNKGVFADDIYIYAKSPIKAVRQYAIEIKKDPKSIIRDYESKGSIVVYGKGRSYVYKEKKYR